jgi:hypothetical protein
VLLFDAPTQLSQPFQGGQGAACGLLLGRPLQVLGHDSSRKVRHAPARLACQPLQLVVLGVVEEYLGAEEGHG